MPEPTQPPRVLNERNPLRRKRLAVAAAMLTLAGAGWACAAQPGGPIDGSSFAGVELPIVPVDGHIRFAAQRAWVWSEPGDGPTQRLVLEGDVRATLGRYEFSASRASVWLNRLPDRGGEPVYQVYAVFDQVRTPAADAAIAVRADRLPVQGVIAPLDAVSLRVDVRRDGRPTGELGAFDAASQATFARRLGEVAGLIEPDRVVIERPRELARLERHEEPSRLPPDGAAELAREGGVLLPTEPGVVALPRRLDPLFVSQGTFSVAVGERVVVQAGQRSNSVVLSGGVSVQYSDPRSNTALELSAQRGVVFLQPGALADQLGQLDASDVEGIYLEGEVLASDGSYTLRGPRVYYDVPTGRAVVLDAVFWTYHQPTGMPLYVRAESIRQQAAGTFVAEKARLANTAFHNPHFTIGASDVTVTVYDEDVNEGALGGRAHVDARGLTLRGAGVPLLYFPRYMGDPEQFPLRAVQVSDSNRRGLGVQTTWNAFALLGIEPPPGVGADVRLDYFDDAGLGLGLEAGWDRPGKTGDLTAYLLPDDNGRDISQNGEDIDRDGETRGFISARHMQSIGDRWKLRLEGAYVSDELFLDSYFPRLADRGPELTNKLHLARTVDNTQLWGQLKVQANDFLVNQWLLQSPGYAVDKLPEIGYIAIAEDVFKETAPGLLTHTWEASVSMMRLHFSESTARDYGFRSVSSAMRAFGTLPDESLGNLFRSIGLDEDFVGRFDTRHELSAQLRAGPVNITPFVVGRLTAYDTDFESFSPDEGDSVRLWGSAGVKLATRLQRVNNGVDNALLDLHRIRHIVEPSLTVWNAGTNVKNEDLPIYDDGVEGLAEGTMVRVGLDQTWQTKRGGPGRWRSVDVLRLNAEYVWSSDDTDRQSPIGRFYAWRPELSNPGEFVGVDAVWQVSEVVGVAGEMIYDVDASEFARWSGGVLFQHSPHFRTSAELRSIESQDATYGNVSAGYELTDKYSLDVRATYNFDVDDFQAVTAQLHRDFPNGSLGLEVVYDNIRGETSVGFVFRPAGVRSGVGLGGGDTMRFGG